MKQRTWPTRLLYFGGRSCWPADTGAKLRNWYLPHAVARHARVTFLSFEDDFTDYRGGEAQRARAEFAEPLERVVSLPRDKPYSPRNIVKSFTGDLPITVLNYTTETMARTLEGLLDEHDFDVVQMEGVHLGAYLPIIKKARRPPVLVCDWHNIESEVQRRFAENTPDRARGLAARYLAWRLETYEKRFAHAFDAHVAVSQRDAVELSKLVPGARVYAVENGVDIRGFDGVGNRKERGSHVVFVGSMDYHANVDAAREFARDAWPQIRKARPSMRFSIVGRNPTSEVKALAAIDGIDVVGSVEDVRPYYEGAVAAIVPLRIGGGSRLKILEAMAAGVPVVSTRLGAEGIPCEQGTSALLSETIAGMAAPILSLVDDAALAARLSEGGRALVRAKYDWSAVGEALMVMYDELGRTLRGV